MFDVAQPWWLLPGFLYSAWMLWIARARSQAETVIPRVQARRRKVFLLHALTVLTLLFAAAGLQLSLQTPHRQIVLAADVSDSVFDLPTQDARLFDLMKTLPPEQTELAVSVFGRNTGLEQPLRPLPDLAPSSGPERRLSAQTGLPSIARPTSVVDRSASDIGAALQTARGMFDARRAGPRGLLLLSDFRDTAGRAKALASALNGSGIDLLAAPVLLGPSADVCLSALELPPSATLGRALPIEVTLSAQAAANVRVSVWRRQTGGDEIPVGFKTVQWDAPPEGTSERKVAVRFLDTPPAPGVSVYIARVSGADGELAGDVLTNNTLAAAVRVQGPSRWAVLTRAGSTLAGIAAQAQQPLGAETMLFLAGRFPTQASAYADVSGILLDGLSSAELPPGSAALQALGEAVESGKALVALGGESAFGNGGHREGALQRLLPVEMTPEDDRTRSILFLIDVSKSMEETLQRGGTRVMKKDYASEQLAQAVQKLKAHDRLGLIAFSGAARVAAPLSAEASRTQFLAAARSLQIEANTDLRRALQTARATLEKDDAEEQLVVLLSDGVQTVEASPDEIVAEAEKLCAPKDGVRRTTLFTFGIGVDAADANPAGEALLKRLATTGGGTFSPDFLKLAERLEQTFEGRNKDFFVRRETFGVRAGSAHALLSAAGTTWPALGFRNRVKAKPDAETLLWSAPAAGQTGASRRPDPLLVLSGATAPGLARRAVLALGLDGTSGGALMNSEAGQRLMPSLLAWAEGRAESGGPWSLLLEQGRGGALALRAIGRTAEGALNGRQLRAVLQPAAEGVSESTESKGEPVELKAVAPGEYTGSLKDRRQGVYRVTLLDGDTAVLERFFTLPYPPEVRAFGVDRAAMQEWIAAAGGGARAIETPLDLALWADEQPATRRARDLGSLLLVLALGLVLGQVYVRAR